MAYKGGKRDKAQLKYEKEIYTPEGAKSLTDKELRKEYSRLRSIARKRLERFEGTEWTDTQTYKAYKEGFKPIKDIKDERELRYQLTQVARFVTTETASVSGLEKQRKQAIETLNDRGYSFVNKKNYHKFTDFMEYVRTSSIAKLYDSNQVAEFFEESLEKRKNMSEKDLQKSFKSWERKQQKLKKIQNINPRNSSQYRKGLK